MNMKNHSSSEETEVLKTFFLNVALNLSEIQSRKHVAMFRVHLKIIVRELYFNSFWAQGVCLYVCVCVCMGGCVGVGVSQGLF